MTKKKEHKNCTPEQLYLKMLEIGSECISCGTNFTKIKLELSKCGLISEKDDEKTLKILFENSFEDDWYNPESKSCLCPEPDNNHDTTKEAFKLYNEQLKISRNFDHHNLCTWFLSQKALMNLLHLRESENNRIVSENSIKTSTRALWISGGSLLIALVLGFSPILYDKFYTTEELKNLKLIQESLSTTLPTLKTTQDSLSKQLNTIRTSLNRTNHLRDSLSSASLLEQKKEIETQSKILKILVSLNKK